MKLSLHGAPFRPWTPVLTSFHRIWTRCLPNPPTPVALAVSDALVIKPTMAALSIDLAHKSYADIGAVVLDSRGTHINCRLVPIELEGDPSPNLLANHLNSFCVAEGIRTILLDGPQGWKSTESSLAHSRFCERELNTPAKTGEPHLVKPKGYMNFVSFSIATYDALTSHGWCRLSTIGSRPFEPIIMESFPLSAWRTLGLKPLPSKRRAREEDIEARLRDLREVFTLTVDGRPNQDQLQAIVAGLAGIAISQGDWEMCRFSGIAPSIQDGVWREGWIVNRKRP